MVSYRELRIAHSSARNTCKGLCCLRDNRLYQTGIDRSMSIESSSVKREQGIGESVSMKAAEMHYVKVSNAHKNEILSKRPLLFPEDGRPPRFLPHHLQVIDARRVTTCNLQEAGGVRHTPVIRDTPLLTPPPVDTSTCSYVRKKTRTSAVGRCRCRCRIITFLTVFKRLPLSPLKKIIAQSSPNLAISYGERDVASLRFFCWVTRDHANRAIGPTCMSPLFFEQVSLRVNMLSRPLSPTALSNYKRRKSQVLPPQATNAITSTQCHSLIDRVLHLRRQLGIDTLLCVRDSEDILLSPRELQESSMETPRHGSPAYDGRDWLAWSQSPGEGNLPEKGSEDLFRCQ
jgi:hypothetical protein